MTKTSRIVRLLNLLYHRTAVSRSRIAAECGISERSAYRYLQSLSEAGFPVYWDEQHNGYRLNFQKSLSLERFDVSDIVTIAMSILSLRMRCGKGYEDSFKNLYRKFQASVPFPIDDVFGYLENNGITEGDFPQTSALLTRLIIQAATVTKTPICVRVERRGVGVLEYVIREPLLVLANDWCVVDAHSTVRDNLPLKNIVAAHVAILKENGHHKNHDKL